MKVAMVTRKFPAFSETFMIRVIAGLIDRGHDVDIYAFKRSSDTIVQGTVNRLGLMQQV
jgi:colanic acid/amylovoran biosynthesis glycosyltransferase